MAICESSSTKMSRHETDSEINQKLTLFNDETLPVISCKEAVQKDPMCVLLNRFFFLCFSSIEYLL